MPTKMQKLVLVFKGLANHRRLEILDLLQERNKLTLGEISDELNSDFRTISEHCRRLHLAGLISKKYKGRSVLHSLTYLGRGMLGIAMRTKKLLD